MLERSLTHPTNLIPQRDCLFARFLLHSRKPQEETAIPLRGIDLYKASTVQILQTFLLICDCAEAKIQLHL